MLHSTRVKRWWLSIWLLATAMLAAPAPGQRQGPSTSPPTAGGRSAAPPASEPGNWTSPAKTYQATRYSELDAITTENVQNLKEVWSFTTGVSGGHEGQPLVVNNTMYVVTPYPNRLFAFDLTRPGFPRKWQCQPTIDAAAPGKACCDVVNRGAAHADGKIIYNLLDNHTIAVDANTGREVWRTTMGSVNTGQTMTMAPLVVGDKVFVGNSGGEMGVRGWIAALDVRDGTEIWRAYSTGPDADVKIGPGFQPFYAFLQGKDMGVRTWRGDQWKIGGGTVWGWISYDPDLHLIYYGTSNPGTWNAAQRPGDNMFATSIFARDPDSGEARWAWQATPPDMWDYDDVNESIVADIPVKGQQRKVIVHFDRNGFATTIDRATGEVLIAEPYQFVNWATGFDFKSGRPILDSTKMTHQGRLTRNICPSSTGARPAAGGVLATDAVVLHAVPQHLHGLRRGGSAVHRRHAVPGCGGADVPGAGRRPGCARQVPRMGREHGQGGVEHRREVPPLERRPRHRG
ncbi:MAG TPA: PQQ-binding-like beta-propeller repeat protein [Gemmatimonadaceae bacterium]|nr:PQQ-binding-like beta-propeller repeat protein [Gemmatimonadaceae bacterium]